MALKIDGGIGWNISSAGGGVTDPDYASVVLHLPLQDDLLDTKGHTMTGGDQDPTITGAQSPYAGGSSGEFDSANSQRLTTPDASEFDMEAGDWTAECWVRLNNAAANTAYFGKSSSDASSSGPFVLFHTFNETRHSFAASLQGGPLFELNYSDPPILANDTWYHVALVRDGTDMRVFVDGVQKTVVAVGAAAVDTNTNVVYIGCLFNQGSFIRHIDGFMADVRLTKGVARYDAGGFTLPTEPYPTS